MITMRMRIYACCTCSPVWLADSVSSPAPQCSMKIQKSKTVMVSYLERNKHLKIPGQPGVMEGGQFFLTTVMQFAGQLLAMELFDTHFV